MGRYIARDAADSAITETRYRTCPWGLTRSISHLLPLRRAVTEGRCSLGEYVGGRPSIGLHQALDVLEIELPKAAKALKPTTTNTGTGAGR